MNFSCSATQPQVRNKTQSDASGRCESGRLVARGYCVVHDPAGRLVTEQSMWRAGVLVVALFSGSALVSDQRSYSTLGPVNTWMGYRLWVNHLGITSHLGQLS